jgi:hypothetical protein
MLCDSVLSKAITAPNLIIIGMKAWISLPFTRKFSSLEMILNGFARKVILSIRQINAIKTVYIVKNTAETP